MEITGFNVLYLLEMVLPATGLCLPLKKRNRGMGKALAAVVFGMILSTLIPGIYIKQFGMERVEALSLFMKQFISSR